MSDESPEPPGTDFRFHPATEAWFASQFAGRTEIQERGWPVIASGRHSLLVAPTGSGKTLAAFLWGIDRAARLAPDAPSHASSGVRILYVSPLKALVYDVERNLRAPLAGIRATAERLGLPLRDLSVSVRTGDTPAQERRRFPKQPGEILVTTPESLYLLLGSQARETLRTVDTVIVDEIHALAPTKRGTHLALSLERLVELTGEEPQRIGLSATVRPLDEIASFLGGDREVAIVDAARKPNIDLGIVVPVPDMEHVPPTQEEARRGGALLDRSYRHEAGETPGERGIWPAIYPALLAEIQSHRATIVFVNSRALCERLARRLNDLAGEELVLSHHGSVSHEKRTRIEDGLKRGEIRAIVATSSLELGIDMGAVDLVLQVESPGSVARGLQRVGRAGHDVGATSKGRFYPKFRGDLLEAAVIAEHMQHGTIEAIRVPTNALDVLSQQVVALCCDAPREVAAIERLVRRSFPYKELTTDALHAVLDMLTGRFPGGDFAELRPRLRWDRARDLISPRAGSAMLARMSGGTIPDRGAFAVHLGQGGPRLGELDEEMVYETRTGDTFFLGASTWRVEEITNDRVIVSPAPGETGRMPFWHGDGPGRPVELGRALGAFVRSFGEQEPAETIRALEKDLPLDRYAAENLAAYLHEQKAATGTLPTDRAITVERFRDELGDWRVCILSPFGSRVHAPWAMALQQMLGDRSNIEVQLMYTDDGIVLRFADVDSLPPTGELFPDPEEVENLVTRQLADTSMFASLFRENAVRSLLMPRRDPRRRNPLWAQRIKAKSLLATVRRHASFPVVLETYRQALSDVFDLPGLTELMRAVQSRELRVDEVETRRPSPFARNLVFAYVASYLYDQDSPLAERKAQALTLDRGLLSELLGQAELRQLLDADVLAEVEAELQRLHPERQARDRDELHDLLRAVGDLCLDELEQRCTADPRAWLEELERECRACPVQVAGESRWIAAEEAGLYRDAFGCQPPPGLPHDYLDTTEEALRTVLLRFARTRGPFQRTEACTRYQLAPDQVAAIFDALVSDGTLVRGEIRPGGTQQDDCHAEILRRLKRRTLSRLRGEVAAVDASTFGRFLLEWHGIDRARPSADRLEEVLAQLEGHALPWSTLCNVVLPARVPGFRLEMLDLLCATGKVVWVGRSPSGPKDGKVALYRRETAPALIDFALDAQEISSVQQTLLELLKTRGASFITELERGVRAAYPGLDAREFEHELWNLAWSGRVTNDTFEPLKQLGGVGRPGGRRAVRSSTLGGGRWWRVDELADANTSDTEKTVARARSLLERHGIVTREAALAEELPGGFGPIYRVLREMEETGRIRRGYFIEGLSGAQFALPGAVDRLRAARLEAEAPRRKEEAPGPVALAAIDPANPWGALVPWPQTTARDGRPRRIAGAWVVLLDGEPWIWSAPNGRTLLTFQVTNGTSERWSAAFRALAFVPRSGRRRSAVVETIDGVATADSSHVQDLEAAGYVRDYGGHMAPVASGRAAGNADA